MKHDARVFEMTSLKKQYKITQCCGSLIWNNSLVRIAGEAVFYKNWAKAGVKISKTS